MHGVAVHPYLGGQPSRALAQEGQVALVPLLCQRPGRAIDVGDCAQAVLGGNLLQQVGLADVFVGREAPGHAQIHQEVLGQADDFGRSALRHRQLDRAELAGKHFLAGVAGPHRDAQFLAEIEHSAVEPVELLVLFAGARSDGDEACQQATQAMHVLVDLQQTHVACQLGVRPPIDLDLGDRR